MVEQTAFYIFGSIFFAMAIVLFFLAGCFWIRILKDFSEISSDLKKAANALKEKAEGLAGLVSLGFSFIEKIAETYQKKKKVGKKKAEEKKQGAAGEKNEGK